MQKKNYSRFFFLTATFFFLSAKSLSAELICKDAPPFYSLKASDQFQFGKLWQHIKRLEEKSLLCDMIQMRREEIARTKAHWKEKIDFQEDSFFFADFNTTFSKGTLIPAEFGCGSAYFLLDEQQIPRFVIKPFDEDILCLNNRKHFASPYNQLSFRVRDHIPLYRSAQAEALSYTLACLLEFEHLTPKTHLTILIHENFFDVTDHLAIDQKELHEKMGPPDREKLCSIQPYLSDITNLYDLVDLWLREDYPEEEILSSIDRKDFEKLFLFIWLLYDTDAHAGNLYAQLDEKGVYHLLKIDNGLTFPNKNSHLLNALFFFPHANLRPSEQAIEFMTSLPLDKIAENFIFFEMEDALDAFYERVEIIQHLLQNRTYTFREIDMRLRTLELPDGRDIALSHISLKELEKLMSYE